MSYSLRGNTHDINTMSGFLQNAVNDVLHPVNTATQVAASITPAGLMWLAPPAVQRAAAARATPEEKQAILNIGQAQMLLQQLGLFKGTVNGTMSSDTQQALDQFRQAVGLPMGGPVTTTDIAALNQAVQSMTAQTGIQLPTQSYMQPTPGFFDSLPPWALPVGLVGGALILSKLMK